MLICKWFTGFCMPITISSQVIQMNQIFSVSQYIFYNSVGHQPIPHLCTHAS